LFFITAIFTSDRIPFISFWLALLSLLLFFTALVQSIVYFYYEFRSIGKNTKNNSLIQKVKNFNLSYYEKLIEGLSLEYSLAELKTAEMTLALLLQEKKAIDRMFLKFTRAIAIFFVLILYANFYHMKSASNPIEYLQETAGAMVDILHMRTREVIGLIILIVVGLNIILAIIARMINSYEVYLIVLRKAIDKAKEKERRAMSISRLDKRLENNN
jgi:hypothetical protein